MKRCFAITYIAGLFGVYSIFKIPENGNNSLATVVFPVLYIFTLIELIKVKFNYRDYFSIKIFIILFTGLLITSLFSYNIYKSIFSVINLGFNYLFGYWLFKNYSKNEIFKIVLDVLLYILFISVIVLIVKPDIAIYFDPLDRESLLGFSNIKGIFPHKIHAGIYCTLGFILARYFYGIKKKKKYIYIMIYFVLGVLSTGSSLAFLVLILILILPKYIRSRLEIYGKNGLLFFVAFIIIGATILFYFEIPTLILNALGRDMTLTGRVPIWRFGIEYIKNHFWVGGGFNAFFDDVKGSPAQELWSKTDFYRAPSFHNGYLEIIAESGVLGGLPFLTLLMHTLNRTLKQRDYISFTILLLCIISNLAAAVLIKQNMFFFVFLIYTYLYQQFSERKIPILQRV